MRLLPAPMDDVPYPQPLTGHEPQYVPWRVLRVRPNIPPPPRAGATMGRRPTVPGVSCPLTSTQAGPIWSLGGPPNPSGQVPCQAPRGCVGGSCVALSALTLVGLASLAQRAPSWGRSPPYHAPRIPVAPCFGCIPC